MKILHILDHSLPLHSGYTFRSHNILRSQEKSGLKPVVLTSPKHEESWKKPCEPLEHIHGMTYYRTPLKKCGIMSLPFFSEIFLMAKLTRRIIEVANIESPDILHAHSPVLNAIPAIIAGKRLKLPVMYEIRAFWEDAAVDHGTYSQNSMKYKIVRFLETLSCRFVDHIGILCNGLKNDLIQRGIKADKITVIFNGVNPNDFIPVEPDKKLAITWKLEGKKVIGFIGSFYRYEGLDLLVRSFALIAKNRADVMLLLVGGGEMSGELRKIINELGIEHRLVMPGRIDHDKIPGVYALIDILAYPRYSMRLTELVTPLKPLEAMAMGKAVIASNVGGHRELIQHKKTGMLFEPGNIEALANTIETLLNDKPLYDFIRTNAYSWVRQAHTWEKTTDVYHDIYDRLKKKWSERKWSVVSGQ